MGYFDVSTLNVSSSEIFFSWRVSSLNLDDLKGITVTYNKLGSAEVRTLLFYGYYNS